MKKTKYLLDTNICIFLLRGDRTVAAKIIEAGEGGCCISVITVCELLFGACNSKYKEKELCRVNDFIKHFPVVPLSDAVYKYAEIKTELRLAGAMIDEFDVLIAATALSGHYTLVTDNLKHFQRINGLEIENWVRRDLQ